MQTKLAEENNPPTASKRGSALGELVESAAELLIVSISGCAPKKE